MLSLFSKVITLARSGSPIKDIALWPALALADTSPPRLYRRVDSGPQGLTEHEADQRLARDGENRIAPRGRIRWPALVLAAVASPFVALLLGLDLIFLQLGDVTTTATVRRRATDGAPPTVPEVPVADLVVGDLVLLGVGDLGAVLVVGAVAVLFGLSVAVTPAAALPHLHPLPLTYLPLPAVIVLAHRACVRWIKPG
jgi:hypothetical protein